MIRSLIAIVVLVGGCASPPASKNASSVHPSMTGSLDAFCRSPTPGVFALPSGLRWHVVIADTNGVSLGWKQGGAQKLIKGPQFRNKLPSREEMNTLSLGQLEAEVVGQFGAPSRTGYDLYPFLDSVVPITRIFGRDTKHCDYRLFTTTATSDIVEMAIGLSYTKNQGGHWHLTGVDWKIQGNRESEPGGAANGSQPFRFETNQASSTAGSRR